MKQIFFSQTKESYGGLSSIYERHLCGLSNAKRHCILNSKQKIDTLIFTKENTLLFEYSIKETTQKSSIAIPI